MKEITVTLNDYERDNLLLLLNVVGYGNEAIQPYHFLNNGDWVGQIASKIAHQNEYGLPILKVGPEQRPNMKYEYVKQLVGEWLTRKIKEANG